MVEDAKAVDAAGIDATQVTQDVSYIGARLREKSTYGGMAVALSFAAALFHSSFPKVGNIDPQTLATAIEYLGLGIGTFIGIFLPEKGSPVGKINPLGMGAVLLAVMLCGGGGSPADAAPLPQPRPASVPASTTAPLTSTQVSQNPLLLVQQISTEDLQAALADAQAQVPPDQIGINCYQGLLNLKQNPALQLPSGQVPGVFTAIQKGRDLKTLLANIAAPNGPLSQLSIACAAWTQDNIGTLIAVGGAIGLVANPAGATALAGAAVPNLIAQISAFLAAVPK